jgi:hypothetical protein
MNSLRPILVLALSSLACLPILDAQADLESWHLNVDGATGSSWVGASLINSAVLCDVQSVQFSDDNVYIHSSGIPRYPTGPYPAGNPAVASEQDYLFRIPREPAINNGFPTGTGLGAIGVLVNGLPLFNASDAMSYNNQGVWFQNAVFFENGGFDCSKGHPAQGAYHHHQLPMRFDASTAPGSDVCDDFPSDGLYTLDVSQHSPIIGWAFDGYPIYGPFGHANEDGSGAVVRIESSYQFRNMSTRTTLADGTALSPWQYGPAVGAWVTPAIPPGAAPIQAHLGAFLDDYEFVSGSGHLDAFNGRFAVTPEYPDGVYAYYATLDADYNSAYPYFLPTYRGVVATDNFPSPGTGPGGTSVVINESVETYVPAEPCANLAGDLNGDQLVGVGDVLLILGDFGCATSCNYDIDGDGAVTVTDVLVLLGSFGTAC